MLAAPAPPGADSTALVTRLPSRRCCASPVVDLIGGSARRLWLACPDCGPGQDRTPCVHPCPSRMRPPPGEAIMYLQRPRPGMGHGASLFTSRRPTDGMSRGWLGAAAFIVPACLDPVRKHRRADGMEIAHDGDLRRSKADRGRGSRGMGQPTAADVVVDGELNPATFFLTQAVVHRLIDASGGSVVNVGSMCAHQAVGATPSGGASARHSAPGVRWRSGWLALAVTDCHGLPRGTERYGSRCTRRRSGTSPRAPVPGTRRGRAISWRPCRQSGKPVGQELRSLDVADACGYQPCAS